MIINSIAAVKVVYQKLYQQYLEPICRKHDLTRAELDVLLFLANNPGYDTATDIVEFRGLAKSHVSGAVAKLEEAGYLERSYRDGNRRTIHLTLLEKAMPVVQEGQKAQQTFVEILHEGITQEELVLVESVMKRITENVRKAQKED